jgi:hypothetical protein
MNADTRKIAGNKELVQFDSSGDGFYEDNNLEEEINIKKKEKKLARIIPD